MGESKPSKKKLMSKPPHVSSSRVAPCRNCHGTQPHVKDTWFPWDSAKSWSCCSSLQVLQRLGSHKPEGSLAYGPAVNCWKRCLKLNMLNLSKTCDSKYSNSLKVDVNPVDLIHIRIIIFICPFSLHLSLHRVSWGLPANHPVLAVATQLAWGLVQCLRRTSTKMAVTVHLTWLFHETQSLTLGILIEESGWNNGESTDFVALVGIYLCYIYIYISYTYIYIYVFIYKQQKISLWQECFRDVQ